jgi:hypothetical protein
MRIRRETREKALTVYPYIQSIQRQLYYSISLYVVHATSALLQYIYNTCALSKHIGNMCMRPRNGGKGEVLPKDIL